MNVRYGDRFSDVRRCTPGALIRGGILLSLSISVGLFAVVSPSRLAADKLTLTSQPAVAVTSNNQPIPLVSTANPITLSAVIVSDQPHTLSTSPPAVAANQTPWATLPTPSQVASLTAPIETPTITSTTTSPTAVVYNDPERTLTPAMPMCAASGHQLASTDTIPNDSQDSIVDIRVVGGTC